MELTAEDAVATLTIEDDGAGFPADVERRLFERFAKSGPSAGHRLGLAFVRAIVLAHGGRIAAGSRARGGAFVTLTLSGLTHA